MRRLIQALLLLTALPLAAAEVYRYIDENGNVVYTDRPVPGAELINVDAPFIGDGPAARPPLTLSNSETESDAGDESAGSGDNGITAAERAASCEAAQARRERYMTSHRLFRTTSDGEREYLSSEEIDEARAQAAADVEQWCN